LCATQAQALRGFNYVVDPQSITQPILRPVLQYWEQKRGGRKLPGRGDIDPEELKPYLRHLFLIEVLGGGTFRYRLVGTEITERYGRNSTGKTVREIYAGLPAIADWLTGMMLAVTERKRPVLAIGTLKMVGKEHIFSESLHLPLSDDGDSVTMIFGAARYSASALSGRAAPPGP
jgi:hypothetical protein